MLFTRPKILQLFVDGKKIRGVCRSRSKNVELEASKIQYELSGTFNCKDVKSFSFCYMYNMNERYFKLYYWGLCLQHRLISFNKIFTIQKNICALSSRDILLSHFHCTESATIVDYETKYVHTTSLFKFFFCCE